MIKATLKINDGDPTAQVVAASWKGLQRAVVFLWTSIQAALNTSANPQSVKRRGGGSRTVYTSPSKPGEPPHKRTGHLQRNVLYEFDEANKSAKVGVTQNAKYGMFLEVGTKRVAARPWLLATLNKVWAQLEALAGSEK